MKPINFATPFTADRVDDINGVIRGVSILTAGIVARGHNLTVDSTSLEQVHKCAMARGGRVPVKLNHAGGAENVCGYIENFRRDGSKLIGDFFILESHPNRDQLLETARRMPEGVGLSASFISPEKTEYTKDGKPAARCTELLSVDVVTLPAANPSGFFSARYDREERPLTGVDKVRRVIGAASRGAEVGAVGGIAARVLARRRGITADGAATAGAAVGALAAGAYQWRRDSHRDLAARVVTIVFQQRAALGSVLDATRDNVSLPVPGAEAAGTAARIAKKPLVRRIGARALKIGIGAGAGLYAGRKWGGKAGAIGGAVAGALFESPENRDAREMSQ